jgi:hypothetical protein
MRTLLRGSGFLAITALVLSMLAGCTMTVPIKDPVPSAASYMKPPDVAPATLVFTDARTPENKAQPAFGRLKVELTAPDKKPFDPVPWLAANTMKELGARGVPAQLAAGFDADGRVRILGENTNLVEPGPFHQPAAMALGSWTGGGANSPTHCGRRRSCASSVWRLEPGRGSRRFLLSVRGSWPRGHRIRRAWLGCRLPRNN